MEFWPKIFVNLYPSLKNSTTHITCEGMAGMAYEVMRRPKGGGMLIEHSIRDGNTKQAGNKTEKILELNRFGKNQKKRLIFTSGREFFFGVYTTWFLI